MKLIFLLLVFKICQTTDEVSTALITLDDSNSDNCDGQSFDCNGVPVTLKTRSIIALETYYVSEPVCLQNSKLICLVKCSKSIPTVDHCTKPLSVQKPMIDCFSQPDHEYCSKIYAEAPYYETPCLIIYYIENDWYNLQRISFFDDSIGEFFILFGAYEYYIMDGEIENNLPWNDCTVLSKNLKIIAVDCQDLHKKHCFLSVHLADPGRCPLPQCQISFQNATHPQCLCPVSREETCNEDINWKPTFGTAFTGIGLGLQFDVERGLLWGEVPVTETGWDANFAYGSLEFQEVVLDFPNNWRYGSSNSKLCAFDLPPEQKLHLELINEFCFRLSISDGNGLQANHLSIMSDTVLDHQIGPLRRNIDYNVHKETHLSLTFFLLRSRAGYFWAAYLDNTGYGFVESQRVLIPTDDRFITQMTIRFDNRTDKDPLSSKFFKKIRFKKYEVNWMKTLKFDLQNSLITYLIHVYAKKPTGDFSETFNEAKEFFGNLIKSSKSLVKNSEMTNLEFCNKLLNKFNSVHSTNVSLGFRRDQNYQLAIHECMNEKYPEDGKDLHKKYKEKEIRNFQLSDITEISELRNLQFCDQEITYDFNGLELEWPVTKVNESALSEKLCLTNDGQVVKRKCLYDYYQGVHFEEHDNCTVYESNNTELTNELMDILNSDINNCTTNLLSNLTNSLKDDFSSVEIFLISEIFQKIKTEEIKIDEFGNVLNNLMQMNGEELQKSQKMNSTDQVLSKFEEVQRNILKNKEENLIEKEEIFISTFDLIASQQLGFALLEGYHCENPTNEYCISRIFSNMTDEVDQIRGLKLAVHLSELPISNNETFASIAFYLKCSIFNEVTEKERRNCAAESLSILLPDFGQTNTIKLYFNGNFPQMKTNCGFWDYGENKYGKWNLDGGNVKILENNVHFCEFDHITNFALLFGGGKILSSVDQILLDIYTIFGAVLTCFSTAAFYMTAILFEHWRKNTSNKALLHYATLVFLQVAFLYISTAVYAPNYACYTVGALFHYVIVAKFLWSLMFAFVQYQKLVKAPLKVFDKWNKVIFVCYFLPLIPVICILAFSPESYLSSLSSMCYISGMAFKLALLIPMSLVLTINTIVFMLIGWELFRHKNWGKDVYIRCATLLTNFVLLGFTWSFGIYGEIFQDPLSLYIFALLINFQSFFIFIKFLVLRKEVRDRYSRLFNQKLFEFGLKK